MKSINLILLGFLFYSCSENDNVGKDITKPEEPEEIVVEPFKANRLLIKHGLQLQCWVATDNFKLGSQAGQPAYEMLPSDWSLTGFTCPTFYGPPLINPSYFKSFPESQWAIAKAPYGDHIKKVPTDYEEKNGFLSDEQKAHLSKLTTICFGDEEEYSYDIVKILKAWYDITRRLYPDVLVHNNQYINQWSTENLRTYIREAKPDLITYDWYYFKTSDPDNYIGARDMASHLQVYRKLSLEGLNENKSDYLAFGQYIQGFVNQGTYKLTESQLRLYYYMTWTFGGKWLNWFRYLQGDGYGGHTTPTEWALLLENGMPGFPTKYMKWVNKCNTESKYIGDYLVRLKTKDVRFVPGSDKYSEGLPNGVSAFSPSVSCIKKISSYILQESDESADFYIGFYDIIPVEEQGDPSFFKDGENTFFMITNGLASKTNELAEDLSQKIIFGIDLTEANAKSCFWINPNDGKKEELEPVLVEEKIAYYEVDLKGGSGALFGLNF